MVNQTSVIPGVILANLTCDPVDSSFILLKSTFFSSHLDLCCCSGSEASAAATIGVAAGAPHLGRSDTAGLTSDCMNKRRKQLHFILQSKTYNGDRYHVMGKSLLAKAG